MPANTTMRIAGKPLAQILKDVLDTLQNDWNYFLGYVSLIKNFFKEFVNIITDQDFFTFDYSIKTLIYFLNFYIKETGKEAQLKNIDNTILLALNKVIEALQKKIISHTPPLNESQQKIINHYLNFLYQLMESEHRALFDKPQISLNSNDLQAIGKMLTNNNASMNDEIIEKYISLLRLSFDVPKFLAKFDAGLDINPLAQICFLKKNLNSHLITTQFFNLLGYQGQVLHYYKDNPRFNITTQLLINATRDLNLKLSICRNIFLKI